MFIPSVESGKILLSVRLNILFCQVNVYGLFCLDTGYFHNFRYSSASLVESDVGDDKDIITGLVASILKVGDILKQIT